MDIPFKRGGGGVTVEVRVKPRSGRAGVEGVAGEVLVVRLTAPPVDGAANEQLIDVLSRALDVPKRSITIIRGHASRLKLVEIEGVETLGLRSPDAARKKRKRG